MKKRILSLLLAMVMTVSLLPSAVLAADVEKFDDVSKDDWFYKYVDFVTEEGYFVGTSETTFAPQMTMTRAMFVVVMAALEGVKVDNNVAPFADVPANTWYSGAVAWAAENGVIAGVGDNKFAPNAEITREQMAVIMNAYIDWHGKKFGVDHNEKAKIDTFADKANVSDWAVAAVDNCRAWGLIVGAPDGNFYPKNSAARAEVATVVYNLAWLVMGGGGGGKVDYIYNALNKVLADVQEDMETAGVEFGSGYQPMGELDKYYFVAASYGDGVYAQITLPGNKKGDLALNKTIVKVDGVKTRPQYVDFKVNVTHDALAEVLQIALNQAHYLLNTSVPTEDKVDAAKVDAVALKNEIVMPVIRKFEEITGLNVSADKELVKQLVKDTYEYAMSYGSSMIAHMQDKNGKYYTGDVTITAADGTEAVIRVAETAYVENKAEQVANMAVAIAKDLYYDLIGDYASAEFIPVEEIELDTTITIAFSDNLVEGNKYEKHTNAYPYVYPVTISASFDCEDLGRLVEYRYNNGNDIRFTIPQAVQAKYEEYAAKAVEKVLTSDTLKEYAEEKFDLNLDEVMDKAVAEMQGAGAINELKATITELDSTVDADALVDAAMNQWIRDNYTNSGNLLNFVMTGETKFNNNALYGLVEVIAKSAAKTVTDKVADLDMDAVQAKLTDADATLTRLENTFSEELGKLQQAEKDLAAAKEQLADGIADAEKQLADKLAEGKAEGEALIADEKAKAEAEIADAEAKIADAEAKIDDAEIELADKLAELADAKAQVADAKAELEAKRDQMTASQIKKAEKEIENAEKDIATAETKAAEAEAELADAKAQVADAKAQVADAKAQLPGKLAEANALLAEKLAEAKAEGEALIAEKKAEYQAKIDEAEALLNQYKGEADSYVILLNDARALLNDAQEVVDLMNIALTESGPANLISNLEAVSAAIRAIDMDKAADLNAVGSAMGVSIDLSMLDGKAEMIDAMIAEVEALDDAIEPYVIAAVCDALQGNEIGSEVSYTAPNRNEAQAMHAYIDAMIAEQAAVARESYMEEMGDAAAEMQAYLDTVSGLLNTFKSFDNIAAISLGDLAGILENPTVVGLVNALGQDSLVNRATNLIAKLPAEASVSLGDIEISEAALAELQAAETAEQALTALANILKGESEMCLDTFADGVDLTVTVKGRSATLGLYIVH